MSRHALTFAAALLALGVFPTLSRAQDAPAGLAPIAPLIGTWQGPQEGQPGNGRVERTYARILNARFIEERNRSVYAAQEKNPKGETHENIDVFSFDNARKRIVMRQFHQEGFVNHYVMEPAAQPGALVFTTEAIENIPLGYRARETYNIIGPNEIEEVFEIAEPGKDFEVYSRARLTRVK